MADGPPADTPDLIGVALGSLAAGAAAGAATVTAGLLALRERLGDVLPLLPFAGIVIAATVGWSLARPIADWWRRGLTAVLAVFAGLMLAALTAPADMVAGRTGLAAYGLVLLAAAGLATRYSLRSRSRAG